MRYGIAERLVSFTSNNDSKVKGNSHHVESLNNVWVGLNEG